MNTKEKIYKGSGNVFADLGIEHHEKVKARAEIMFAVIEIIKKLGLTQNQISAILSISQPKVSCLMNGKLSMFSMDHLLQFLNALNNNVRIVIKQKTKSEIHATTDVIKDRIRSPRKIHRPEIWEKIKTITFSSMLRSKIVPWKDEIVLRNLCLEKSNYITSKKSKESEKVKYAYAEGVI